ncbi:SAP DNA-binding domain-containing protein [Tieghemostelium lacteum]|uniref:SAP DNA-binding domain-containing protein n=1 Tax=Tieghemostelium lacteum TaxID=361077 RepID=A0A151Z4J3_TIELA|nr:SAP DNA-binding domain-containing protein [Tieghemostelium lacteum]|eukprot:KYQ88865.1 SAP DNA-binding domain-containing protein [Tieghemostelium lacteum]
MINDQLNHLKQLIKNQSLEPGNWNRFNSNRYFVEIVDFISKIHNFGKEVTDYFKLVYSNKQYKDIRYLLDSNKEHVKQLFFELKPKFTQLDVDIIDQCLISDSHSIEFLKFSFQHLQNYLAQIQPSTLVLFTYLPTILKVNSKIDEKKSILILYLKQINYHIVTKTPIPVNDNTLLLKGVLEFLNDKEYQAVLYTNPEHGPVIQAGDELPLIFKYLKSFLKTDKFKDLSVDIKNEIQRLFILDSNIHYFQYQSIPIKISDNIYKSLTIVKPKQDNDILVQLINYKSSKKILKHPKKYIEYLRRLIDNSDGNENCKRSICRFLQVHFNNFSNNQKEFNGIIKMWILNNLDQPKMIKKLLIILVTSESNNLEDTVYEILEKITVPKNQNLISIFIDNENTNNRYRLFIGELVFKKTIQWKNSTKLLVKLGHYINNSQSRAIGTSQFSEIFKRDDFTTIDFIMTNYKTDIQLSTSKLKDELLGYMFRLSYLLHGKHNQTSQSYHSSNGTNNSSTQPINDNLIIRFLKEYRNNIVEIDKSTIVYLCKILFPGYTKDMKPTTLNYQQSFRLLADIIDVVINDISIDHIIDYLQCLVKSNEIDYQSFFNDFLVKLSLETQLKIINHLIINSNTTIEFKFIINLIKFKYQSQTLIIDQFYKIWSNYQLFNNISINNLISINNAIQLISTSNNINNSKLPIILENYIIELYIEFWVGNCKDYIYTLSRLLPQLKFKLPKSIINNNYKKNYNTASPYSIYFQKPNIYLEELDIQPVYNYKEISIETIYYRIPVDILYLDFFKFPNLIKLSILYNNSEVISPLLYQLELPNLKILKIEFPKFTIIEMVPPVLELIKRYQGIVKLEKLKLIFTMINHPEVIGLIDAVKDIYPTPNVQVQIESYQSTDIFYFKNDYQMYIAEWLYHCENSLKLEMVKRLLQSISTVKVFKDFGGFVSHLCYTNLTRLHIDKISYSHFFQLNLDNLFRDTKALVTFSFSIPLLFQHTELLLKLLNSNNSLHTIKIIVIQNSSTSYHLNYSDWITNFLTNLFKTQSEKSNIHWLNISTIIQLQSIIPNDFKNFGTFQKISNSKFFK